MKYAKTITGATGGLATAALVAAGTGWTQYLDSEERRETIRHEAIKKAKEAGNFQIALDAKGETIKFIREELDKCQESLRHAH